MSEGEWAIALIAAVVALAFAASARRAEGVNRRTDDDSDDTGYHGRFL